MTLPIRAGSGVTAWASVVTGEGSREDEIASRVGFEPTTKGLKVPCSAAELPARRQRTRCHGRKAIRSRRLGCRCLAAVTDSSDGNATLSRARDARGGGRARILHPSATSRCSFGDDASTAKVWGCRA
jgi:hypothetical protein